MKINKTKVKKCLKCVKFSGRFDWANGKYLLIFVWGFARTVKVTHCAQDIDFRPQRAHEKIHEIKRNEMKTKVYEKKQSRDKTEIGKEIIR